MTPSTATRAGWTLGLAGTALFMTALHTIDRGATHDQLERTITIEYTKRPEAQEE
jgi:hypothetical protein